MSHSSLFVCLWLVAGTAAAEPVSIYMSNTQAFGQSGGITRTFTGSNDIQSVYQIPSAQTIGVAVNGDRVYATTYEPGQLWSGPASGGTGVLLASRGGASYTRQIEFHDGSMYWNEEGTGKIYRSTPDLSNITEVYSGPVGYENGVWDFTIANDRIYWTSWDSSTVKSVRLDGTDFFSFRTGRRVFSIDSFESGLVLGSTGSTAQVWRTDFLGGTEQLLATTSRISEQTALSIFDGRAYFGYAIGGGSYTTIIESVPLTGGERRTELSVVNELQIFQIDVVPAPSTLLVIAPAWLCSRRRRHDR